MSLRALRRVFMGALVLLAGAGSAAAQDLAGIRDSGVLRHLGVPYANFVTGAGDGLDVELVRGFAAHQGLRYRFVETDWRRVLGDLTGRHARRAAHGAELLGETPVRGDVAAHGMTVLDWRAQVVRFSRPTFPSGVWLVARADSPLEPITPTGDITRDIARVKARLQGVPVLALPDTCLDPALYGIAATGAAVRLQPPGRKLSEMVPAILKNDAEATLLDVPDALIALDRWPGQVKVIGPVSREQRMAAAFRPGSPRLREAFDAYLAEVRRDGRYRRLVERYYPEVPHHFGDFFAGPGGG